MSEVKQEFILDPQPIKDGDRLCIIDAGPSKTSLEIALDCSLVTGFLDKQPTGACVVFVPYGCLYQAGALLNLKPKSIVVTATPKSVKLGYVFSESANPVKRKVFHDHHSGTRSSACVRYLIEKLTNPGDGVIDMQANKMALPAMWCRRLGRQYVGCALSQEELSVMRAKLSQIELPATQMEIPECQS